MERWVEETLHRGFRVNLKADRVLFDSETEHQRLIIFDNADFGRVMMLDSIVQVTTKDEFIYHEMMSHVPLFAHGRAKRVLIVGGGDGGVLREALRHPELEQVTLCEIDRGVIDLCRKYFPEISAGAYDDPRTRIVIADGTKFVAETRRPFRRDHDQFHRSRRARRRAVHPRILCRLPALPEAGGTARHPERAPLLAGGRTQPERRLFPRTLRRRLRLSRQYPDLFRRSHVFRLGHRQQETSGASTQEDRAPPREGRRLPHPLLVPGGPCRFLRASPLRARSGRSLLKALTFPSPRGEGGLRRFGASRVGLLQLLVIRFLTRPSRGHRSHLVCHLASWHPPPRGRESSA